MTALAEALADADLRARAAPICRAVVLEKGDIEHQMDKILAAFGRILEA